MEVFMNVVSEKIDYKFDKKLFPIIAWSHDLLKDRENSFSKFYQENKNNIKRFHLTNEMRKALSEHAYRSAEFLSNYPFNITDGKILYSILFHSSPIIEIMNNVLSKDTKEYVNLTILCDKLSSNYLRIINNEETYFNLVNTLFGENLDEFNYDDGLYLISTFNNIYNNKYSKEVVEYYKSKSKLSITRIEELKLWPRNEKLQLPMQSNISITLLKDANLQDWNTWMESYLEREKTFPHM